ncbi:MAG TPA: recombinase family protein, partial [Symbiobacteriaceae bacterium]|nr:recombinase family protein [Symbiobacteriaceae bacterium]
MVSETMGIDPAKVAIYIRWSTEDQGEGTTLEVQSSTCRAYLVSQGWAVNEDLIFIDDGWSGGSLDRPAMGRLRSCVSAGLVDCVVVYKLDRLSRSVVDTVNLVCREWENRCAIKSAREPIDTTSHAGRMFFYTLVNYAEWERSVIKERTYSGKLRRAQEGKNPGMKPAYGYALAEGGGFTVLPDEAAVVQRIYKEYLAGMGMRVIVNGLNREGIRPRSASAWSQATVQKILSNPVYTGRIAYGRRARGAGGRRMREPVVVTESAAVPVLVSREDWDAVQAMKEGRPGFGRGQGSGRSSVSEPLLTGLLRCKCGHGFAGKAMNGGYRYYRCNGVHQKGSGFCDCGGIRQDVLDDLVVGALRSLYGGQQAKERLVRRVAVKWEQQLIEARAALRGLEKELGRLESGEQRLKRMLRDGELTVAEYRELREDQEREFAAVKAASEKATSLERQAM